jgi:DNA-binding CsgD family transcriptional regulator
MRDQRGIALCLNRLGEAAVALGEHAEAHTHFVRALALFREIGNTWGEAATLEHLGRQAVALAGPRGHPAAATRLLQEALHLALVTASAPLAARVMTTMLPLVRGTDDRAWASDLERAVAGPPGLDALRSHAEQLLAWWWPGARRPALEEAIDAARTAPSARAAPAPTPARAPYPAGLTAREVEVLRLVARGLTDAQVAEQLVVSPRTVSTHLTSVYGKLQVSSRTAATRFAIEHGLV